MNKTVSSAATVALFSLLSFAVVAAGSGKMTAMTVAAPHHSLAQYNAFDWSRVTGKMSGSGITSMKTAAMHNKFGANKLAKMSGLSGLPGSTRGSTWIYVRGHDKFTMSPVPATVV